MPDWVTSNIALIVYAEMVDIAATVFLITRVLEWREARRWRGATFLSYERLARSTNSLCVNVTEKIGIRIEEFEYTANRENWPSAWEGSRILVERLREWLTLRNDDMVTLVAAWDSSEWRYYGIAAEEASDELLSVMATFGGRLDNIVSESILRLLQPLESFLSTYGLCPTLWGLPPSELARLQPNADQGIIAGMQLGLAGSVVEVTSSAVALKDILHARRSKISSG